MDNLFYTLTENIIVLSMSDKGVVIAIITWSKKKKKKKLAILYLTLYLTISG